MLDRRLDTFDDAEIRDFVERLIADRQTEDLRLDYKREVNLAGERWRRDAAKDVSAFANAIGGLIIYGVAEDAETAAPDGSGPGGQFPPDFEDRLMQVLNSAILPRPFDLSARRVEFDSGSVIVLQVPESPNKPHWVSYDQRYYVRLERESRPMAEHEIERAYAERRRLSARSAEVFDSVWVRGVLHEAPANALVWASQYVAVPLRPSPVPPQLWSMRSLSNEPVRWFASPRGIETERAWEKAELQMGGAHSNVAWPEESYSALDDGTTVMWDEGKFKATEGDPFLWQWLYEAEAARIDHFLRISAALWQNMRCSGPVHIRVKPSWWETDRAWPDLRLCAVRQGVGSSRLDLRWPVDVWDASFLTSTDAVSAAPDAVAVEMVELLFRFFGESSLRPDVAATCANAIHAQRQFEQVA